MIVILHFLNLVRVNSHLIDIIKLPLELIDVALLGLKLLSEHLNLLLLSLHIFKVPDLALGFPSSHLN